MQQEEGETGAVQVRILKPKKKEELVHRSHAFFRQSQLLRLQGALVPRAAPSLVPQRRNVYETNMVGFFDSGTPDPGGRGRRRQAVKRVPRLKQLNGKIESIFEFLKHLWHRVWLKLADEHSRGRRWRHCVCPPQRVFVFCCRPFQRESRADLARFWVHFTSDSDTFTFSVKLCPRTKRRQLRIPWHRAWGDG